MAEALINVLLEQLVTVAFDHTKEAVKLISNAEAEVEKFRKNLKAIQAALEDAEKQQVENASVRNWLEELNDVSYEMIDVLDEWNTEILKQKANGVATENNKTSKKVCFSIPSNCFCFDQVNKASHLYRTATKIKKLNEKLTLIADQKQQFEFHQSSSRSRDVIKPLQTSSYVDISKIYGRDEATADLLSKLLSDSSEDGKRVLVIPIVGLGGIGKTTLAQLAYNNENVKGYFEKSIWVCVSDPFDVVKIAKAIVSGTGNNASNLSELQDVLDCMSECLKGKKCLIVLDDVWTEDQREWESLKLPIIMETCAKGSKVVVTTRKERVAKIMGATTHMILIEKLSEKDCLALFNSIAYLGWEEDEANGFGAIGEKIAKKCNGLPLAARTLGAVMQYKKKIGEWQEVLDSKIWELKEVKQQVFQPLLLSYYELASEVKRCLLYCATFPKDYRFEKQNLIELWMSQDYLSEMEKTGQYVFDTLVMRSFFQDVIQESDEWCSVSFMSCKMHDIVHDFVQYLNKNECLTVEPKEANTRATSDKVRHLSLLYAPYNSPFFHFFSPVNCRKLRTLATFDSRLSSANVQAISEVKCLRTLNLSSNGIKELPEELGELLHLRYLDLSDNWGLEKLPDSLGDLYNLQTLRLDGCSSLRKLPENMGNLINLRHFHNKDYGVKYLPRDMARLTSLQTLRVCRPIHDDALKFRLGDLGSLDQLQGNLIIELEANLKEATKEVQKARLWDKKLDLLVLCFIKSEEEEQSSVQFLEALRPHEHLESLCIEGYGGSALPRWMISLQNLRSLALDDWVGCECLPPLGKLPFLERLSVMEMNKVKTVGDEFLGTMDTIQTSSSSSSSVFFPKLKKLMFEEMYEWEQWEQSGGDEITIMPCLDSLTVSNCLKLKNLPLFLQTTPLREVYINRCRRSIMMPVWPDNCNVCIEDEIDDPDVTERAETEIE